MTTHNHHSHHLRDWGLTITRTDGSQHLFTTSAHSSSEALANWEASEEHHNHDVHADTARIIIEPLEQGHE